MVALRVEVVQYFRKTRAFLQNSATFSGTKSHLTESYHITKNLTLFYKTVLQRHLPKHYKNNKNNTILQNTTLKQSQKHFLKHFNISKKF